MEPVKKTPIKSNSPEVSRAEIRPPVREESPSERAARRAEEIRGHLGDMDEGTDEFYISKDMIPDGWTYEWKRRSILNQEDPAYAVQLAREGWEAVPAKRHPQMMPGNSTHDVIERKGMVLMERPSEITEEARNIEIRRARQQVRIRESQLSSTPEGQMDRGKADIKKSYSPIMVPEK